VLLHDFGLYANVCAFVPTKPQEIAEAMLWATVPSEADRYTQNCLHVGFSGCKKWSNDVVGSPSEVLKRLSTENGVEPALAQPHDPRRTAVSRPD
jgi:hypothetical protein